MTPPIMVMTHYIFLSREQRYALIVPESEIEIVGMCTPVWVHNGKHISKVSEEIFAKYRIRHCPTPEEQTINLMDGGFLVRLSPNLPGLLLDYQDEGIEHLNITHNNSVKVKDKISPIVHFLHIEDARVLEETLC